MNFYMFWMQIQTEQFKSFILSNINLAEELLTASEELSVKIRTVTDNFVNIIGTIAPEYLNFFLILSTNLKNKMIQLRLELQGIYQTCQVLKNNYEENLEFLHYLAHFKKKEVKDVNMATKENNMKHISTRKRKRRKINLTPHLDKYCRILTEFRPTKIGKLLIITCFLLSFEFKT